MEFVADLHLHSKYSRAVSPDMILPTMAAWAVKKGIDILTTGDFTHPIWFREIRSQLKEVNEGVYQLRHAELVSASGEIPKQVRDDNKKEPKFLLTVEVSSIYSQGGKLRRIHNLIFSPNFEIAEKINKELVRRGANLMSDGRPIVGISAKDLLELVLSVGKRALLVPCHAWTPWFSLYGSNSGFDSIDECFGEYSKYIYAIETGLSSDPAMNWKIKELENRSILSFSDAHSPAKMGREATIFDMEEVNYENIRKAIMEPLVVGRQSAGYQFISQTDKQTTDKPESENGPAEAGSRSGREKLKSDNRIAYTIEFYPEEGKYHYTGHRNCKVVQSPQETKEKGTKCPVCGRPLTVGVEHRVEELAQLSPVIPAKAGIQNDMDPRVKPEDDKEEVVDEFGTKWLKDPNNKRPPYVSLVPMLEIIAEALSSTTASQRVKDLYEQLVASLGTEFEILLRTPITEIDKRAGSKVAEGIKKVRQRNIVVMPGYDGEYGIVKIWNGGNSQELSTQTKVNEETQLGLF